MKVRLHLFSSYSQRKQFCLFSQMVVPSYGQWPMQPGIIARPRDYTNERNPAPRGSASQSGIGALSLC